MILLLLLLLSLLLLLLLLLLFLLFLFSKQLIIQALIVTVMSRPLLFYLNLFLVMRIQLTSKLN
jgi:hypothetical protein